MNSQTRLLTPLEAAEATSNTTPFYAAYPMREWALVKKIRQMTNDDVCGELCSLRFTWLRPKSQADDSKTFLFQTLPWLLDAAWALADSELLALHIEQVQSANNLFALAMFANNVAAEIEACECLPNSMTATHFIKANFKHGHITNQPLAGHFNEEGSILATDMRIQRWVVENEQWANCADEIELWQQSMLIAITQNTYPAGPLNSRAILRAIQGALK